MGSSYFGEPKLPDRSSSSSRTSTSTSSSSSSSGSRSGKKSSSHSNKQPQRGLGVAQLEKIRIQSQQLAAAAAANSPSSCTFLLHPKQMGICTHESERAYNINYGDSQLLIPTTSTQTKYWSPSNGMLAVAENPCSMTGQYFSTMQHDQEPLKNHMNRNPTRNSVGMDSEMDDNHEELDLELRLSL